MAQLSGGSSAAIRMDQLSISDLLEGTVLARSSTTYSLDAGNGILVTFTGTGLTYDVENRPTGGMIVTFDISLNGAAQLNVTDLATSAAQLSGLAQARDDAGARQLIFANADDMRGTSFDDVLMGLPSHDNLNGGAGADTLQGGTGNDHLWGHSASGGTDGNDLIQGDDGSDYLQGNSGSDALDGGSGSDRILGGQNDDMINGGTGNDTANGNLGNDTISGGDGNDSLRGGQGNDSISGGQGHDILSGDLGVDTLSGGSGVDSFLFSGTAAIHAGAGADVVTSFEDGIDRIGVGYTVASLLTGSAQATFSAAATAAQQLFDGRSGSAEVAAISVGSDTFLFFSSNGGNAADSAVMLMGVNASSIDSGDFI